MVLAIGVLGYLLFTKDTSPTQSEVNTTSETETAQSTSGKEINLSNKGLSEVSKDILDDKSVTKLDVSGNNLSGALPAEIRKLTNLELLDASDNNMTGIPAEIGQLSKLRVADFSNNDLSGLPMEIGNLNNLETLDLRGNPNISKNDLSLIQSKIPNANILTD
jgi:Leucine-rich repeat (LRR) protein